MLPPPMRIQWHLADGLAVNVAVLCLHKLCPDESAVQLKKNLTKRLFSVLAAPHGRLSLLRHKLKLL